MGKQFRLSVADPCHEDWEQMSPVEKGRFCGSCQKQVVDFTDMTDTQIATFFKKSTGSVCGRFMDDQLNRNIAIPKKRIPWVKYFFHFTWPLFIASLKSCTQKNSQDKHNKQESVQEEKVKFSNHILGAVMPGTELEITQLQKESSNLPETFQLAKIELDFDRCNFRAYSDIKAIPLTTQGFTVMELITSDLDSSKAIAGRVIDEDGNAIPYASIMINRSSSGAQADEDGRFKIDISSNDSIELEISSVGFETKSFTISNPGTKNTFQLSKLTMDEVVVVGYPSTRCYALTGAVSYISVDSIESVAPIQEAIQQPLTTATIYPNPLPRGGTMTIQLKNNEVSLAQIRILALDGKLMSTQALNGKDQVRFTVQSDSRWAAGIYLVQLIDQKGKLVQTEKIVLQ